MTLEQRERIISLVRSAAVMYHNASVMSGLLSTEFSNQGHRRVLTNGKACEHPDCVMAREIGTHLEVSE